MPEETKSAIPAVEAPAIVIESAAAKSKPAEVGDLNIAPKTTAEEDLKSRSHRDINAKWENTQQWIALSVVWISLTVAAYLSCFAAEASVAIASTVFIYGVANLVIGFYFGRTNHTRSSDSTQSIR